VINPGAIPQFTGDLAQLESATDNLRADAGKIRDTGVGVNSKFQGLSAYYKAPEAEQLFATTKPVADKADKFGDDLEKVSSALTAYAGEIQPIVAKLKQLKIDAANFVEMTRDDDDWQYDDDKVAEHNRLRHDITVAVAAFWAAERTCHNKITALFGGTQVVAGDGSDRTDQYGFNAEDMENAKLPWGDPVEEKHHWYEIGHWIKSFVWDGLIVDGVWGTIKGLGTLAGFGGWEAFKQSWIGLGKLATGLALSSLPVVGTAFMTLPDDKLPSWLRDSRTAMKETGKALLAWDQWGKNPARAAGAVTFNVLTAVFTDGAGAGVSGAGKAGAAAKVLSAAGKAGRVIDPMTYVMKGAGAGLSKIGDVLARLKGIGNIEVPKLPDGAISLPDGTIKLPDGPIMPEGTVKLPTEAGAPAQYLDNQGNILDDQGNVIHHADQAPKSVADTPHTDTPHTDTPHTDTPAPVDQPQPALVGAGANVADNTASAGRVGDNLSDLPRAGDDLSGAGRGVENPGGGIGHNGPGGVADNLPGGRADDLGRGPSASHEPPGGPHNDGPAGGHGQGSAPTGGEATPSHSTGGSDHGGNDHGGNDPGGADPGGTDPSGTGGYVPKGSWHVADDVQGSAHGKDLTPPHPRHSVEGSKNGMIRPKNSVFLRGYEDQINKDVAQIAEGKARWNPLTNRYEINGRSYGVEPSGRVYPDSGKGIVNLDRNEYAALKELAKAGGDPAKVPAFTHAPRFVNHPEVIEKAKAIYEGSYQP
jgi:hypothetical protein